LYEQAKLANYQGKIYHFDPSSNGGTGATIRDAEGAADIAVNGRSMLYANVMDNYFTGLTSYFNVPNSQSGTSNGSVTDPADAMAGKSSNNTSGIVINGNWYPRFCQPSIFLYNKDVTGAAGGVIHHYEQELSSVTYNGQFVKGRSEYEFIARDMELLLAKAGVAEAYIAAGADVEVIKDHFNVALKVTSDDIDGTNYHFFPFFKDAAHIAWWNGLRTGRTGTGIRPTASQDYVSSYLGKTGADLEFFYHSEAYNGRTMKVELADGESEIAWAGREFALPNRNATVSNVTVSETGELVFESNVLAEGNQFFVRVGTDAGVNAPATWAPGDTKSAVTYQIPGVDTMTVGAKVTIQIWRQMSANFTNAANSIIYEFEWTVGTAFPAPVSP
jgi:hypothetical protein